MSALRRTWSLIDGPLSAVVALIIALGLVNLYSATRVAPKGMFSSQLMWMAIGVVLLVGVALLDQQLLKRLAWPGYLGVTGLLAAVLVVGKVVNGSRRWFGWGSFGIQPSELMKLSLILLGAHLFSSDPKDMSLRPWRYALLWHGLWIVPALLILKQPDLGTALLCGLLALSVFFLVPLPPRLKGWVATVGLSGAFLIVRFGLKEYQKKRLLTFLHPELDPTGTGYHARQALFAIGSGRLTGKRLSAWDAEPSTVSARALDRLSVRGVGRRVGSARLSCAARELSVSDPVDAAHCGGVSRQVWTLLGARLRGASVLACLDQHRDGDWDGARRRCDAAACVLRWLVGPHRDGCAWSCLQRLGETLSVLTETRCRHTLSR